MAAKYHAKRVVLFGSCLSSQGESRDIDIGVEGIAEEDFFTFYGELLCALSKPVIVGKFRSFECGTLASLLGTPNIWYLSR